MDDIEEYQQFAGMDLFANNLRERARELGLTNAEVARRAELGEQRYGNYVTGLREPDLATLGRLALALETSPDRLLGFQLPDEGDDRVVAARYAIIDALRRLDGRDAETVAGLAVSLASRPATK